MICPICGKGKLRKETVRVEKFDILIGVFEAEVCQACGEQIFDSKESAKIEKRIKELGLWGVPVESKIYKVGGNFVVSIKKTVAQALGITKPGSVRLIPQGRNKLLVEVR